jgi:hypothetical protein
MKITYKYDKGNQFVQVYLRNRFIGTVFGPIEDGKDVEYENLEGMTYMCDSFTEAVGDLLSDANEKRLIAPSLEEGAAAHSKERVFLQTAIDRATKAAVNLDCTVSDLDICSTVIGTEVEEVKRTLDQAIGAVSDALKQMREMRDAIKR